jgi:hypothetical protein
MATIEEFLLFIHPTRLADTVPLILKWLEG